MTRTRVALVSWAILLAAGGPSAPPPRVEQPAGPSDEDLARSRFESAYFEIACIANAGKDPEMTLAPLRRPGEYLDAMADAKDLRLARVMEILNRYGFSTADSFKGMELRLRTGAGGPWWQERIETPFVDRLKACKP